MIASKPNLAVMVGALVLGASAGMANASYCSDGKTVTFAGINWQSGAFVTEVMKTILSDGYDCKVDAIPGNSVTLEQATANNDVQIFAEEWVGRSEVWNKATEEGKVTTAGKTFVGSKEGWFVPRYLIEGDAARGIKPVAPDLKSVSQLSEPQYVKLFADPEEPSKGRFLNCPSGWTCEGISTAKLEAYKLDGSYVNFRPGTGTALDAALSSAYLQGLPVLLYYWSPNALMAKFDLVLLDEPAYSDACWAELSNPEGKRDEGCAFPPAEIVYGLNSEFAKQAPEIVDILNKATFPLDDINSSLAYMMDQNVDATAAAAEFLKTKGDVWGGWVSPEARQKIEASLK